MTPGSMRRSARAREVFPSGVVHDGRRMWPYPLYVERAKGAYKWDVDGNRYIDYFGGHGALILGHGDDRVLRAVHEQLERGTHYAACHDLEVEWGERLKAMVPCAERVRFMSSGTEANLMALRIGPRPHREKRCWCAFAATFTAGRITWRSEWTPTSTARRARGAGRDRGTRGAGGTRRTWRARWRCSSRAMTSPRSSSSPPAAASARYRPRPACSKRCGR